MVRAIAIGRVRRIGGSSLKIPGGVEPFGDTTFQGGIGITSRRVLSRLVRSWLHSVDWGG